jgi:membrane-bound lytic murein transglycosylase D
LALISKDPSKYGFEGLQRNPTLRFDTVVVNGATPISLIARLANADEESIRFLNPQLRLGVTPPYEKQYEVKVPAGTGVQVAQAYEALPESERITRVASTHTVRRGETLASIASRYGISVRELTSMNGIRNANRISIGTRLTVPSVPGMAPEDESPRRSTRKVARGSKYAPYHVVRRGDTLSAISRAYGVPLRSLMAWNGLSAKSKLMPGARLVVGRGASSAPVARPTAVEKPPTPAGLVSIPGGGQSTPDPAGEKISYRVRRGDNLFRIAMKYRTTVENLRAWNNLPGNDIRVGDLLTIYPN